MKAPKVVFGGSHVENTGEPGRLTITKENGTSSTITVNYAVDAGASNQVAGGLLHGINATHPAQYLVDGIKINSIRGADYYGYLPDYYESATYNRAYAAGAKLMIGLYYRHRIQTSAMPGDNGD